MGDEFHRPVPRDEIQFGTSRRPWLVPAALAAVVVAGVVTVAVRASGSAPGHHGAHRAGAVILTGHPMLDEPAGWQLFARGDGFLATIDFGSGRVTKTAVPSLQSGNASSFIVGPHEAIVRSYDYVAGYLIPDGGPARALTGPLATGGPLLPGPVPGEVWTQLGTNRDLVLVTLAGRRLGPVIRFLQNSPEELTAIPDGRGYVLASTSNGEFFDLGPTWDRPVHGWVTSIGPTDWLAQQCNGRHGCRNMVIDPATGAHRSLPGPAPPSQLYWSWAPGVIAPNGTRGSVLSSQSTSALGLVLVNLATGTQTPVHVVFNGQPPPEAMAWSPDCRWLFVADNGKLLAVNASTGKVTTLRLGLPPVTQLAVRTGGP